MSVVGHLIGQVLGECLGPPEHVRSDNYVHPCVCFSAEKELSTPNCCLLSYCQSDYEILFNLLGGRVSEVVEILMNRTFLFLYSLYCLAVRCQVC